MLGPWFGLHAAAVDEAVATVWARLRLHVAETGRRLDVNDLWIASTALANQLPLVAQDRDVELLAGYLGFNVVQL